MMQPFPISIEPVTRFPMIKIPRTNYALALLPVTKIQIEYFLCETLDGQFNRRWYQERLDSSPRVPLEQLTSTNVRQVFMTDLLFYEARTLSQWWGKYFDLPTVEEWRHALEIFDQIPAQDDFIERIVAMPDLHPRAQLLLHKVEQTVKGDSRLFNTQERKLSHQLLMRAGILEYTYKDTRYNACTACGSQRFSSGKESAFEQSFLTPLHNVNTGERIRNLGFRLVVRNQ